MIMCVLLCYPVSIHMPQLLSTGRPISSFSLSNIICIKDLLKLSLISYSVVKNLWEFQPLGWFITRGGPLRTLRPLSEHCCTSVLQSKHLDSF